MHKRPSPDRPAALFCRTGTITSANPWKVSGFDAGTSIMPPISKNGTKWGIIKTGPSIDVVGHFSKISAGCLKSIFSQMPHVLIFRENEAFAVNTGEILVCDDFGGVPRPIMMHLP